MKVQVASEFETRLASAVIQRAFEDLSLSVSRVHTAMREDAYKFLTTENEDLALWCQIAGVEMVAITSRVRRMVGRDFNPYRRWIPPVVVPDIDEGGEPMRPE